jgi:hypothetical protein
MIGHFWLLSLMLVLCRTEAEPAGRLADASSAARPMSSRFDVPVAPSQLGKRQYNRQRWGSWHRAYRRSTMWGSNPQGD